MNFASYAFHPQIAAGISAAGYVTPTPIQVQAIPNVMQGQDVMGLAQTGTGKTAAFVLPILHRLLPGPRGVARALILAPTRELAEQIHQATEILSARTTLRSVAVYGGMGLQPQIRALKQADIVVACPGRLLDHIGRRTVNLSRLEVLVLDEADQMFDMGFLPDIRRILGHLPRAGRQTLLFSATMPGPLRHLANEILNRPVKVQVGQQAAADTVSHIFYPVSQHLKTSLLFELLRTIRSGAVLVFTRTKHRARQLDAKLSKAGFCSTSLQGNLSQTRRLEAMNGFKSGKYQVLVATDIAARGIDVANISHVINFDLPTTADIYIHRIGRTGRAERSGQALTFVSGEDPQLLQAIRKVIGRHVEQRDLPDFNAPAPNAPPSRGRLRPTTPRRARHPANRGPGDRDAKGVFAWLAPQRA